MSGKISGFIVRLMTIAIGMLLICAPVWAEGGEPAYPYHGVQFDKFVDQSFAYSGPSEPKRFYDWMDRAYRETRSRIPGNKSLLLGDFLASRRALLTATKDPAKKSATEIEVSANVHKLIKAMIPRFSLDRGFEFRNVVKYGERQCFLQSVLIAGMLQRMGMNAGVAMVYRNITGQPTNNGHAITLLKLPDGKSIIVDASEPEPFARHQGLFVRTRGYQYVDPVYVKKSDMISFYRASGRIEKINTDRVHGLDLSFLDSQFWFYRGE
ncbi:hypothetical protein LLG39_00380, partial [bacterium]|nr:hypothetical protein [bacterium]